jgi:hypothetical protein
VAPDDWGDYVTPSDESEHVPVLRPAPEPQFEDAVPVYIVDRPGRRGINRSSPRRIAVPAAGGVPVRVVAENHDRAGVLLLNESATIIRIGETESDASTRGAALPASQTSYLWIASQDSLYAIADTGTSQLTLSVIEEFGQAGESR